MASRQTPSGFTSGNTRSPTMGAGGNNKTTRAEHQFASLADEAKYPTHQENSDIDDEIFWYETEGRPAEAESSWQAISTEPDVLEDTRYDEDKHSANLWQKPSVEEPLANSKQNRADIPPAVQGQALTSFMAERQIPTLTPANAFSMLSKRSLELDQPDQQPKKRQKTCQAAETTDPVTVSSRQLTLAFRDPYREMQVYQHMENPQKFCSLDVYAEDDQNSTPLIGDIFNKTPTISVKCDFEAGGNPKLSLKFSTNNFKNTNQIQAATTTYQATWRPGVAVGKKWMVTNFRYATMVDYRQGRTPHLPAVYRYCPYDKQDQIRRIVCFQFTSNAVDIENTHPNDWIYLSQDEQKALNNIFYPKVPVTVVIWFESHPNPECAKDRWIRRLARAIDLQQLSPP